MVCWPLRSELSPGRWRWSLVCLKSVLSPEAPCEGTAHCPAGGPCGWSSHPSRPGSRALPSPDSDFCPGPLGPEMDEGAQEASEGGSVPASAGAQTASCPAGPSLLCARALGTSRRTPRWRPQGSCRAFSGWSTSAMGWWSLYLASGQALGALLEQHTGQGPEGSCCPCPLLPRVCFPLRAACFLLLSAQRGHVGQG